MLAYRTTVFKCMCVRVCVCVSAGRRTGNTNEELPPPVRYRHRCRHCATAAVGGTLRQTVYSLKYTSIFMYHACTKTL